MTCSHPARAWEPLLRARQPGEEGPVRFAFAKVPVCATCRKIMGEYVLFSSAEAHVKAAVKAFTGISWSMMIDSHPWPPFAFKMGTTGTLIPENYAGELKNQAELAAEADESDPPF